MKKNDKTLQQKRGALYTKKYIEQAEQDAAKLQKQLTELSNSIRKAKEHLKEKCNHPRSSIELKTERLEDDYGCYAGIEYFYKCNNCHKLSRKYTISSLESAYNTKIYFEFTNREFTRPLNRVENKS